MPPFDRREFLKILGASAIAGPGLIACSKSDTGTAIAAEAADPSAGFYDLPMKGNARILHITDVHGQLNPVYFREPNVNLGVGDAFGRPPHIVGKGFLKAMGLKPDTPEAYAYTYLNFLNAARKYGRTGGFAQMKTLLDQLRASAGGRENTLTIDGGDLWQGSGTALWTRGVDMVEASNILGLDVMVGHWEFTYRENEVLSNVALFKGDFIGQNVRVKEDALFGDEYPAMVEKYDGRGLYDEDTGHAFRPYVIKKVGGARIAVVGQAFPRTANANPQEFFPDWSFGLREDDMISLVKGIREDEVLSNVALFKGDFIGQNVRVKEDALFGDEYATMVEKYDGRGLYDEDTGHAFRPYVIKTVGGARIAVVGQAFPRTANANPQEFFPDWSFGLREDDMISLVKGIREDEKPDAVVLLSHNGMHHHIKMAERVPGLNAVFGGHTHDGVPRPVEVKNVEGNTCLVTNAGSNSKFVGVMDFGIDGGKIKSMDYKMLPIISDWLDPDKEMQAYIDQMRQTKYDEKIIESRSSKFFFNPARVGKTYQEILGEKLAIADRVLYRRGNFMGTWDQVLCNALRHEYDADIALSAGVRWAHGNRQD